jgi:class 3 adenylate cyclase/tetratricopeptide (TPR) repeat protein
MTASEEAAMTDREQLEAAIAAQDGLRGSVPDEVVDLAIRALRQQLESMTVSEPRRRHATVLFADVRGFTALAEHADAEIVGSIMNDVWALVDRVIVQHGGRIDKHIGDAVMAVWGAETSGEDDPERAIRAALELQRLVALDAERTGRALTMRVGITTGPVLLTRMGTTGEFTAMGDTVNVAARLEGMAPPGGVLVSHETYRHVRGIFDVSPASGVQVRGRERPIVTYVVRQAKPQGFRLRSRGVEGVETRLVGRDDEFAVLRAAFQGIEEGGPRAVTLLGEAGIGKSRLLHEFENWIELLPTPVYFLRARALPTRQAAPFGVIRDLLSTRFEIVDRDPPPVVADKLAAGFAGHLTADESALVGRWLGFDLPAARTLFSPSGAHGALNVGRAHVAHYVRSMAASHAVLVVLEDLHWADDESLDLLEHVVERVAGSPVLLLAAARPSFLDRRPDWLGHHPGAHRLAVSNLTPTAARELVHDALHVVEELPEAVERVVVDRADGNPFFVEELIKMLIDDGVIVTGEPGEPWAVDLGRLDAAAVPATLTGVLEARLDSLTESQRDALQGASVVGRVFWGGAVTTLVSHRSPDETAEALQVARRRELIFPSERPSLDVSQEYLFKHALLRDVTYETVLLRDRQRLHLLVADWLCANAGERIGEFLELIAEHEVLGDEPVKAAEHFDEAARRALDAGRSTSAKRLGGRALDLWASGSVDPPAASLIAYADACCRTGAFADAERAISTARTMPMSTGSEAEAAYLTAWMASERGDRAREREALTVGLPLAEQVGGAPLIHVLMGLSWLESGVGDPDAAERHARRALRLCEDGGHLSELGRVLNVLGVAMTLRDDLDGATDCANRALAVARSNGDLELESIARGNLGVCAHLLGDGSGERRHYEDAAEHYREQAVLLSRLGLDGALTTAYLNLAQVSLRLGRRADAEAHLAQVLARSTSEATKSEQLFLAIVQADLLLLRGDVDAGLRLLGAVDHDPARREHDRREIERVLHRANLDPAVIDAGMATGTNLDLADVVAELAAAARGSTS